MSNITLNSFKCFSCEGIPSGKVYVCKNKHTYCGPCANKSDAKCECKEAMEIKGNPLQAALGRVVSSCEYKPSGCTWAFAQNELKNHRLECKYRPSKCIGAEMGFWKCNWTGKRHEMEEHFKMCHRNIGEILAHAEQGVMNFKGFNNSMRYLNLINAFNKTFVFYYSCDLYSNCINIIIFLLGRKQEAQKYLYELEIYSPTDKTLKVKFNQNMFNDTEDIEASIRSGKCVCLPFNVVKNFIEKDFIFYRFRLLSKPTT